MILPFNCERAPGFIGDNLQALSWSFSHFFLWRPNRIQFDCGEGAAMRLDNHVFRTEVLAFSHGHFDHCRGLLGMLSVRAGLKGATDKPLLILYPDAPKMNVHIDEARRYVESRQLDAVSFRAVADGEHIELRGRDVLEARSVRHDPGELCLAYRIGRAGKRLKAEYRGLSGSEVAELARLARRNEGPSVNETFLLCKLVYSGDTEHLDPDFARDAQVLIHEATFLDASDIEPGGHHSTVESALRCAREANVRSVVLFHISRRYELNVLVKGMHRVISNVGLQCPVLVIRGAFQLPTD